MKNLISAEERERRIKDRFQEDGKEVVVVECEVCSFVDWRSSRPAETSSVVIEDLQIEQCPACGNIARRYPELMDWILGVIAKAQAAGRKE